MRGPMLRRARSGSSAYQAEPGPQLFLRDRRKAYADRRSKPPPAAGVPLRLCAEIPHSTPGRSRPEGVISYHPAIANA